MATTGGQPGNQNAAKAKQLSDGLRKALATEDWRRFKAGCEKVADEFEAGNPWAIQFVFDRIDGKAKQQVEISGDPDNPITVQSYLDALAGAAALRASHTAGLVDSANPNAYPPVEGR